ncbi:hypothetical protein [Porticoccus hydrocarbonoclasticus]|nr:hypothetical protein [Porticoccus hydrocarbonoclasticus]
MKTFVGKVVIVTGATSGLGEATILKLTLEGASFVSSAVPIDGGDTSRL